MTAASPGFRHRSEALAEFAAVARALGDTYLLASSTGGCLGVEHRTVAGSEREDVAVSSRTSP